LKTAGGDGKPVKIELHGTFRLAKPVANFLDNNGFKIVQRSKAEREYTYKLKDARGNSAVTTYGKTFSFQATLKTVSAGKPNPKVPKFRKVWRTSKSGKKFYLTKAGNKVYKKG